MSTQAPSVDAVRSPAGGLNLDRYPVHRGGAAREQLIETCREGIERAGIFVLPDFITRQSLELIQSETDAALPAATPLTRYRTSYQSRGGDQTHPSIHPRNILHLDSYRLVKQSGLPPDSEIIRFYESEELRQFLSDTLDRPLQRIELGDRTRNATTAGAYEGVNINVQEHGDSLIWHFDNTDFVVTVGIEQAVGGGEFQYVPFIRSDEDERYDDVMSVFVGNHPGVQNVVLEPGTLVGFAGRRSLHRVAPIYGPGRRITAVLGFNDSHQEVSRRNKSEYRI